MDTFLKLNILFASRDFTLWSSNNTLQLENLQAFTISRPYKFQKFVKFF